MDRDPCARSLMKGQSEIMEYLVMVILIVAAIITIILFLSWWNITQLEMQGAKNKDNRILAIGQFLMEEQILVNDGSIFDDAKLTSLAAIDDSCKSLERMLGTGWYAKVKSLDMAGEIPCTWSNYPNCNTWIICKYKSGLPAQKFPMNVYRKSSDRVSMGILEVGVYA